MHCGSTSPDYTLYAYGTMANTSGNVIDPIDTMEEYGCDALRFTLALGTSAGQDISLDDERIKANRNFVNKLWNAGVC